jgi:hypothetical protein
MTSHVTLRQEQTRRPAWVGRTYLLTPELVDRIDAAAERHHVGQSDLVRFLLSRSLLEVETGALEIPTRPARLLEIDDSR